MIKPHYQHLRDQLFQDFLNGPDVHLGQKLPTERELQSRYAVSRPTISKAIAVLTQEGLLTKRQGSGIYVASLCPQMPRGDDQQQRRVGCIVQSLQPALAHRIFEGVENVSRKEHCLLEVATSNWKFEEEKKQLQLMRARGVQGVVLYPTVRWPNEQEYLGTEFRDFPIVVVDTYQSAMKRPHLIFDNVTAGRDTTRSLLAQGHKKILFLNFEYQTPYRSMDDRLAGYRMALEDAGQRFVPEYVISFDGKGPMTKGHIEALERVLAMKPRPTALITPYDQYAEASIEYLRARGIAVPREMVVTGFDDLQKKTWGERFPTTHPDFVRMGERAMEMLLDRMKSHDFGDTEIVLPCPFVSPPPEPAAWRQAADALPGAMAIA